jgi:hypothetical protein
MLTSKITAVISGMELLSNSSLKRECLLFDKIAITNLETITSFLEVHEQREELAEIDWLLDQGILFEVKEDYSGGIEVSDSDEENEKVLNRYWQYLDIRKWKDMRATLIGFRLATQYSCRRIAYQLRKQTGTPAYAVLRPVPYFQDFDSEVSSIVINAFPIPDEQTPWEQITEFRNDPDSQNKFLDLRNWMNEISRAEHTPIEIEQKLEYLLSQYERHMALHTMKINRGVFETAVVSTGETLENIMKLRWGKLAKAMFSIRRTKLDILEAELNAPGNEIAYIVKASESFGTK